MTIGASNTLDGCIDRFNAGWLLGWAWRSDRPSERQAVDVYVDDVKVVTCRAEHYRADLERAGKGDGCCASIKTLSDRC